MDRPPENEVCSTCRGEFYLTYRAICTHWFCTSCILQLLDTEDPFRALECPICGHEITSVFLGKNEKLKNRGAHFAWLLEEIQIAARSPMQRLRDLTFLVACSLNNIINPQRLRQLAVAGWHALATILWLICNFGYVIIREIFKLL